MLNIVNMVNCSCLAFVVLLSCAHAVYCTIRHCSRSMYEINDRLLKAASLRRADFFLLGPAAVFVFFPLLSDVAFGTDPVLRSSGLVYTGLWGRVLLQPSYNCNKDEPRLDAPVLCDSAITVEYCDWLFGKQNVSARSYYVDRNVAPETARPSDVKYDVISPDHCRYKLDDGYGYSLEDVVVMSLVVAKECGGSAKCGGELRVETDQHAEGYVKSISYVAWIVVAMVTVFWRNRKDGLTICKRSALAPSVSWPES
jgi:hypothetical protein